MRVYRGGNLGELYVAEVHVGVHFECHVFFGKEVVGLEVGAPVHGDVACHDEVPAFHEALAFVKFREVDSVDCQGHFQRSAAVYRNVLVEGEHVAVDGEARVVNAVYREVFRECHFEAPGQVQAARAAAV